MTGTRITLEEHLSQRRHAMPPQYAGGIAALIGRLAGAAGAIQSELAHAALRDRLGYLGGTNVTGDQVKKLDVWGHEVVVAALRKSGACAALVSEEAKDPIEMPEGRGPNGLVVACDPVDGSSNLDVNGAVGTIFSLRPSGGKDPAGPAALGPVAGQLAAGYVMYGPSCTLVYTAGQGTHGFTLDHATGEFLLTHPDIKTPARGKIYGINEAISPRGRRANGPTSSTCAPRTRPAAGRTRCATPGPWWATCTASCWRAGSSCTPRT